MPIKVLRLITRLNAGGPARHAVWLTSGLESRGYETRLAAGRVAPGEDDLSGFAAEWGVRIHEIAHLSREISPLRDRNALREVSELIERFEPDILHTHTAKAGLLGRWAARRINARRRRKGLLPIRVVHTFHGNVLSGYFSLPKELLFRSLERSLARRFTDAVVALSPEQREEIVQRFRVAPADRTFVIPLALDLSAYERLPERGGFRRQTGVPHDAYLIGIVGRIAPIKNHEMFLRSAALLARRMPNARFAVVGGGDGRVELERLARHLGLAQRVAFTGVRTDLPEIYSDLDAVVLTSRNEGTPLSLIEAMAAGRPIVATDVGGVRDLLTKEWTGELLSRRFLASGRPRGLLVPSGEEEAFAEALLRIAGDGALARSLGEAGREYALRFHGLPRLLDDLDRLYRFTLSTGNRLSPQAPGADRNSARTPGAAARG